MEQEWNWTGSRWWKVDFHTHTPASDYGGGSNNFRTRSPREWLLDFMKAGVDCVAITDHNTGKWIDKLDQALAELKGQKPPEYRDLHLFPGVELTVSGDIHALVLFPDEFGSDEITRFLGGVCFDGKQGDPTPPCRFSLIQVIEKSIPIGGIVIPAHVDKEKGLFRCHSGPTLQQTLDHPHLYAYEVVDPMAEKPGVLSQVKKEFAEVIGSDCHLPKQAGQRFTWVKMSRANADALKLALQDRGSSTRRFDDPRGDPNRHSASAIEEIKITEAKYIGRGHPFTLSFNPWLNCIIGGRGTGKSSILEFLRITMRREADLTGPLKKEFEKYITPSQSRNDSGLLTVESRLCLIYRKDGQRFRIQWDLSGEMIPIESEQQDGRWAPAQGEIKRRFPARIYSQKQIFQLSEKPHALLRIVDDSLEVNIAEWEQKWEQEESQFLALRAEGRRLSARLKEESNTKGDLEDVRRKLAVFEDSDNKAILQDYQRRKRQAQELDVWRTSFVNGGDQLRKLIEDFGPQNLSASLFDKRDPAEEQALQSSRSISSSFEFLKRKLEALANEADQLVQLWDEELAGSRWSQSLKKSESDYKAFVEQLRGQGATDPDEYGQWVLRRQELDQKLHHLAPTHQQLQDVEAQAEKSLERLLELRRELTRRRRNFLKNVTGANPYVRINVLPYGDCEALESEFRKLIAKEGNSFQNDILPNKPPSGLLTPVQKCQQRINDPNELKRSDLSVTVEKRLADLREKVRAIWNGKSFPFQDARLRTHISSLPPESLDRLDCWYPQDSLLVEYSPRTGKEEFRSVEQGSPGQKTAAILAFLLSYGEDPLVLDQPEDDLDNHLIYELIVNQLHANKQRRQIIVVTHNPNIVVNGDSELVIAVDSIGGQTHIVVQDGLQERRVRDKICDLMEGGREAFERRYRMIAGGRTDG